jgi:DNA-binding transcriptional MocR family regulator
MDKLYEKIANELAADIQLGIYISGEKIPSVRKFSRQKSVSISTIAMAYGLLEDQGLVRSKPQSGYFVREGANDPIQPPPISKGTRPNAVSKSDIISTMLNATTQPGLLNLGAAIAHDSFMPHKTLQTHIQKVSRFQSSQALSYIFSPGYEPLRRQIATRMRQISVKCHPDEVIITQGCSEALSLCLNSATQADDIIAVESPCYYGYLQLAKQKGLKVIEIPTDSQTGMSLEALSLALKQWPIKLILTSSRYSNPTGAVMDTQKQQQLYKLAQQFDVKILEDDVYGELGFNSSVNGLVNSSVNTVLKTFDVDDRVMYCSSFSKTLAPGLRIGWCLPGKTFEHVVQAQSFSSFSPSAICQLAVSSFLESGHLDKHLRKFRQLCQANLESISMAVRQHFPDGTCITRPTGGFVLWVKLPDNYPITDLPKKALERGISLAPGGLFSNSDDFDQYLRLNCALPMDSCLRGAIKTLGELVHACHS